MSWRTDNLRTPTSCLKPWTSLITIMSRSLKLTVESESPEGANKSGSLEDCEPRKGHWSSEEDRDAGFGIKGSGNLIIT